MEIFVVVILCGRARPHKILEHYLKISFPKQIWQDVFNLISECSVIWKILSTIFYLLVLR